MSNALNVKLGVCSVTYKGVDLGHTIGGVSVVYTPEFYDSKVDAFGSTPVEQFLVGENISVECQLAEFTLANLQVAINQSTLVGDDSISVGSKAGKRASENAGLLVLHPINSSGLEDDVSVYKAVVTGELQIEHKNDGEKVLPVMFKGLIDENRTDGNLLFYVGDSIS